jgi:hypothetical protein
MHPDEYIALDYFFYDMYIHANVTVDLCDASWTWTKNFMRGVWLAINHSTRHNRVLHHECSALSKRKHSTSQHDQAVILAKSQVPRAGVGINPLRPTDNPACLSNALRTLGVR